MTCPTPIMVTKAQRLIGELNWIGRMAPGHGPTHLRLAQPRTASMPLWLWKQPPRSSIFLRATKDDGLRYVASPDSFGKYPELRVPRKAPVHAPVPRGYVFAAGQQIAWSSNKKSMTSLSTAESECCAVLEGVAYGEGTKCVSEEIMQVSVSAVIYSDNAATVALVTGSATLWRFRSFKNKAAPLQQLHCNVWQMYRLDGIYITADLGTKSLTAARLEELQRLINMGGRDFSQPQASKLKVKAVAKMLICFAMLGTVEGAKVEQAMTLEEWATLSDYCGTEYLVHVGNDMVLAG